MRPWQGLEIVGQAVSMGRWQNAWPMAGAFCQQGQLCSWFVAIFGRDKDDYDIVLAARLETVWTWEGLAGGEPIGRAPTELVGPIVKSLAQ